MTDQLVSYRCGYDDCSNAGVERPILETDGPIPADDPRRRCEGSVLVDGVPAQCFRPLDRVDPDDGSVDHVDAARPQPDETELQPDPTALWDEIDRTRGAQLQSTDWILTPPPDLPAETQAKIDATRDDWLAWRQALRDLGADQSVDPTTIVWPDPPAEPPVLIPDPPGFVQREGAAEA